MANDPQALWNLLNGLLSTVVTALGASPGGTPANVLVANGAVALDDHCETGFAFISLTKLYPSWTFPVPQTALQACFGRVACEVALGVIRCAPGLDPAGGMHSPWPSLSAINASSAVVLADAQIMATAILAYIAGPLDGDAIMTGLVPYGPEGGCVGHIATCVIDVTTACWS